MLRKFNYDVDELGGFSKKNCRFIRRKQKIKRWRIIKGRLKFSYAHKTIIRGRIVFKKYLVNKKLWYSQKKNCLLGSIFEKKCEITTIIYKKKICVISKINWF